MSHQYDLCGRPLSCVAFDCPFKHLADVLYLLFRVIRSFRVVIGKMPMAIILNSKATKARSCHFDVMGWIVGAEAIEAHCQERAIVFYKTWVSSDEEDKK